MKNFLTPISVRLWLVAILTICLGMFSACKQEAQSKKQSAGGSDSLVRTPVDDCEGLGLQDEHDQDDEHGHDEEHADEHGHDEDSDQEHEGEDHEDDQDHEEDLADMDTTADPAAQSGASSSDCGDSPSPTDVGPVTNQSTDGGGNQPSVTSGGSRKTLEECAEENKAWIAVVNGGSSPSGCGEPLANFCCQQSTVMSLFPVYADRLKERFDDATADGLKLYHCSMAGNKITFHLAKFADGRTSYRNVFIESDVPADAAATPAECPAVTSMDLGFPDPHAHDEEEDEHDDEDEHGDDEHDDHDEEDMTTAGEADAGATAGETDGATDGATDGEADTGADGVTIIDDEIR